MFGAFECCDLVVYFGFPSGTPRRSEMAAKSGTLEERKLCTHLLVNACLERTFVLELTGKY